ncbi:ARI5A protein, partial [Aegotheles bennettii]|nr:ARI5A protein [Aegotheles bennettii]
MSPLAKKKLLAQVSKAEALHCHKRHCLGPEPPRLPTSPRLAERRSPPEPSGAEDPAPSIGSEVGPVPSTSPPGGREEGAPVPAVFTGCFHAYRSEVPAGCHPLWGYFSSLKEFLEPSSTIPARPEEPEQPREPRSKGWRGESRGVGASVQACWVPPGGGLATAVPGGKRGREEETVALGPGTKLRAISPFLKEAEGRDTGASSPRGHQGLAKPKAVVASRGYSTPLQQAPDVYKGATLHFPASFGNPLEHLKTQGVPAAPSLTVNPFIIPAFPSPLVATSTQPSDLRRYPASYERSLRHRLYPAATWHSQGTHSSAFHHHAKL